MAPILGEKVAREEIEGHPAGFAIEQLDPQEGLHRYVGVAVAGAGCPVIFTDVGPQASDESAGGPFIGRSVQVLDLLADDPRRHRVYIEALHGASEAVRLDQRRPAPHERVRDADARQVIRSEKGAFQAILPELREDQPAKQGSRAAGKPFVNANDRAIVLLDLLFPERHFGDQGNIETPFDAHWWPSLPDPKTIFAVFHQRQRRPDTVYPIPREQALR